MRPIQKLGTFFCRVYSTLNTLDEFFGFDGKKELEWPRLPTMTTKPSRRSYDAFIEPFINSYTAYLDDTMGACASHLQPHEPLNEYDFRYFQRVETRNSLETRTRPWWRQRPRTKAGAYLIEDEGDMEPLRPLPTQSVSDGAEISLTTSTTSVSPFSTPQSIADDVVNTNKSSITPSAKKQSIQRSSLCDDRQVSDWHVKRQGQGHAWHLRVAKHRLLQLSLSTSGPFLPGSPLSPVTLDSAFADTTNDGDTTNRPSTSPLASPRQSLNKERPPVFFEGGEGVIWKNIVRTSNVTALAVSKTSRGLSSFPSPAKRTVQTSPLILAMGDEQGTVVVTELLDDLATLNCWKSTGAQAKEALELSVEGRVRALDFSSGGEHLVVGGDGCLVYVIHIAKDGATGEIQELSVVHQINRVDRIYGVQFSPDARLLAVGGFDGKVSIVPMQAVWNQRTKAGDNNDLDDFVVDLDRSCLVYCVNWSPSGEYLAVTGSDKMCAIYDTISLALVHETTPRAIATQSLQWSPNGSFLAMGDREVSILEGKGPSFHLHCEISQTTKSQFCYRITSLCWCPSSLYLAIGGVDGVCLVVETRSFALVHEVHRTGSIVSMAWGQAPGKHPYPSSDMERYLALGDESCNVAVLKLGADPHDSESNGDFSSEASSSHFSVASDWVFREDAFREIEEITSQESAVDVKDAAIISAVAFSKKSGKLKQSTYMAFASDCALTIMTTRDWKAIFQIEFAKPIRSLVFSHSNNYLALGGDEGVLYVLSVPSRSMILNTILDAPIRSVAFSRHDERLSIGLDDGVLSLLVVEADWEPVGQIEYSDSPITSHEWCRKALAVGRLDGTVSIFDTEKVFSNFFVPMSEISSSSPVRSLAFGAGGRYLAIGGDNKVLSIISSKGGWVLCNQINVGCTTLSSMKWSPAGRYIALAGSDSTFRVLDTITWATVREVTTALEPVFNGSCNTINCIDWSLDSRYVVIGSAGTGIHILSTKTWSLVGPAEDSLKAMEKGLS